MNGVQKSLSSVAVTPGFGPDPAKSLSKSLSNSSVTEPHRLGTITFVRNRMFYARAALNGKGDVQFGLRHIHVLNRYPDNKDLKHTVQIMKYIFPRQFGLHNVFTSIVDRRETIQPFKDYTLREQEIALSNTRKVPSANGKEPPGRSCKVPKRLRGDIIRLVAQLQKQHGKCSYTQLLRYYCPVEHIDKSRSSQTVIPNGLLPTSNSSILQAAQTANSSLVPTVAPLSTTVSTTSPRKLSMLDYSTPASDVSAYCRAVILNIVPDELFGTHEIGRENRKIIMSNIDRFVKLRRFESLSLHEVMQGMKIITIPWLKRSKIQDTGARTSQSDLHKRSQIFHEVIYYIFDSLLIPLIRSNFHVTESNIHRNRLFFFRHDLWRSLLENPIASLRSSMFEEVRLDKAKLMLDRRSLGFSQIRLLPKETGVRLIMNLRRRPTKQQNGKTLLGRSINSIMTPVFNTTQPRKLGSALFSVGDMYLRLNSFKSQLHQRGLDGQRLYFAKVDVQSCFDSIPQKRVIRLMEQLVGENEYRLARHAEIKPSEGQQYDQGGGSLSKPARKFLARARAGNDFSTFVPVVEAELAQGKKNTVFVDAVVQTMQDKETLLDLLEEHVQRNIVKIGKKFYRQKEGIPQGSVVSSLLCNFFYADFEAQRLGFLRSEESLLLRLIDDFLLITVNRAHAEQFLRLMHKGDSAYGISVNPEKSLANFEVTVDGIKVSRRHKSEQFPYCGNLIDTNTLELSKDRLRRKTSGRPMSFWDVGQSAHRSTAVEDSLTVEYSRIPGKTFHRKALQYITPYLLQ
ncbi:MAG: hypothetical protein M1827_003102 [Pycnora praestabilis]|nr:MAG: hypothetical protein M1827_003102 [Pycnora praestabilis]